MELNRDFPFSREYQSIMETYGMIKKICPQQLEVSGPVQFGLEQSRSFGASPISPLQRDVFVCASDADVADYTKRYPKVRRPFFAQCNHEDAVKAFLKTVGPLGNVIDFIDSCTSPFSPYLKIVETVSWRRETSMCFCGCHYTPDLTPFQTHKIADTVFGYDSIHLKSEMYQRRLFAQLVYYNLDFVFFVPCDLPYGAFDPSHFILNMFRCVQTGAVPGDASFRYYVYQKSNVAAPFDLAQSEWALQSESKIVAHPDESLFDVLLIGVVDGSEICCVEPPQFFSIEKPGSGVEVALDTLYDVSCLPSQLPGEKVGELAILLESSCDKIDYYGRIEPPIVRKVTFVYVATLDVCPYDPSGECQVRFVTQGDILTERFVLALRALRKSFHFRIDIWELAMTNYKCFSRYIAQRAVLQTDSYDNFYDSALRKFRIEFSLRFSSVAVIVELVDYPLDDSPLYVKFDFIEVPSRIVLYSNGFCVGWGSLTGLRDDYYRYEVNLSSRNRKWTIKNFPQLSNHGTKIIEHSRHFSKSLVDMVYAHVFVRHLS
jgi:hypothetical protein